MSYVNALELHEMRLELSHLIKKATSNIKLFTPLERELLPNLLESLGFIFTEANRRNESND